MRTRFTASIDFWRARLHPDNIETGHAENFQLLKTAYDVLSDPAARAEYDAKRRQDCAASPFRRQSTSWTPSMAKSTGVWQYWRFSTIDGARLRTSLKLRLAEIEERMGFPRDYLDFTMWYLAKKGYISRADNAQFTLTAEGVDYVEAAARQHARS